jgi:hypothetical protein
MGRAPSINDPRNVVALGDEVSRAPVGLGAVSLGCCVSAPTRLGTMGEESRVTAADRVVEWLAEIDDEVADELAQWLEDCGQDPSGFEVDAFERWWLRLERAAGGRLSHSVETDVRAMLGAVAEDCDLLMLDDHDAPEMYGVSVRSGLRSSGRAPSGVWEATFLGDLVENAAMAYNSWFSLDPDAATSRFRNELEMVSAGCAALIGSTSSLAARRTAQSVAAVCALHTSGPSAALQHVESFFELDRQVTRESGRSAPVRDLQYVASAGTGARARLGDLVGVHEVMRRVRQLAEPAGESLPATLVKVWARALAGLDPEFAQLLARQLLLDTHTDGEDRSDIAFAAAHLLFQVSMNAGDLDTAALLAAEWAPAALGAPHGPGSLAWLAIMEADEDETDA